MKKFCAPGVRVLLSAGLLLVLLGVLSGCASAAASAPDKDCDCDPARQVIPVAP